MVSNYEKQVVAARKLFLGFSQASMIQKFALDNDEQYLYLPLLHGQCRIERNSGIVEVKEKDAIEENWSVSQNYSLVMTIYDVLCHSKQKGQLSGEWCPLQSLQKTMSSPSPNRLFGTYAKNFSGQVPLLEDICRKMGAKPELTARSADVSVRFAVFPFFPLIFQFWDKDEEFDAQIMLLWDKNALQFLNFETLYYVVQLLLEEIDRRFNLPK